MTPLTDAELDAMQARLRLSAMGIGPYSTIAIETAIRSLRTERDAYRSNADRALEVIKQFRDERDAQRERAEGWKAGAAAYCAERDALRAEIARIKPYLRHDNDCNIHSEYGTGGFCDCGLGPDSAMQGEQQK